MHRVWPRSNGAWRCVVVISIALLTEGSDPAENHLARRAGRAADCYTGSGGRAGVWRRAGGVAVGLKEELDPDGERVLRSLLHGRAGRAGARCVGASPALTASNLYPAVLRGQLTARLGVTWTTPEKGIAEVAGIPTKLISTLSPRRRQIVHAWRESAPPKAAAVPELTLRGRWAATVRVTGHRPGRVIADVLGRGWPPAAPMIPSLARDLLGTAGLTAQATGFDRRDLLQAPYLALPPGITVARTWFQDAVDQLLRQQNAVRLATPAADGPRWSSTELLMVEKAALRIGGELRALGSLSIRPTS